MSALQAIRSYYSLFGSYGVLLAAKARLLQTSIEAIVSVPGIKHPVHLRLRTTDVSTLWQVLVIAEYDCEFSKSPRVIVDAGANIGLTSVFYANKYPEAKIVAIEPESSNFEILKKNTESYANVAPVHRALWKENKELSVIDRGLGHYGFQTVDRPVSDSGDRRGRVLGITPDKLMADYDLKYIDIMKLDIEGAEVEVFQNPSSWIDRVGVIVIELHDRLRTGCSRSVYLAAKDFEFESRKGETLFLMKKEYVVKRAPQPAALTDPANTGSYPLRWKLPFKILRTA